MQQLKGQGLICIVSTQDYNFIHLSLWKHGLKVPNLAMLYHISHLTSTSHQVAFCKCHKILFKSLHFNCKIVWIFILIYTISITNQDLKQPNVQRWSRNYEKKKVELAFCWLEHRLELQLRWNGKKWWQRTRIKKRQLWGGDLLVQGFEMRGKDLIGDLI